MNHFKQSQCPAKEGDPKQFSFENEADLLWEQGDIKNGFVSGLMLTQHDNRLIQNCHHVFHTANLITNSAEGLQDPDYHLVPKADKAIAILGIEKRKDQDAKYRPNRGEYQQKESKQD